MEIAEPGGEVSGLRRSELCQNDCVCGLTGDIGSGLNAVPGVNHIISGDKDEGWKILSNHLLPGVKKSVFKKLKKKFGERNISPEETRDIAVEIIGDFYKAVGKESDKLVGFTPGRIWSYMHKAVKTHVADIMRMEISSSEREGPRPEDVESEETRPPAWYPERTTCKIPLQDRMVQFRESLRITNEAMKKLPLKRRRLLEMSADGLPQKEMATGLGINVKTVGIELKRAQVEITKLIPETCRPAGKHLF